MSTKNSSVAQVIQSVTAGALWRREGDEWFIAQQTTAMPHH
jgi:hypothetical protein